MDFFRLASLKSPQLLLLLLLTIVTSAPAMASSAKQPATLSPSVLGADLNCSNIQFPFGAENIGPMVPLKEFEVICQLDGPFLKLSPNYMLPITDISIEHGTITVLIQAIPWNCPRSSDSQLSLPSLEGTPYTYSNQWNKFTVLGCDAMVRFDWMQGPKRHETGCVSFCQFPNPINEDSCTGVGCCQASIPNGLKNLSILPSSIRSSTMSSAESRSISKNETCTEVFLVEQKSFSFSIKQLTSLFLGPVTTARKVVLDWSIGNETCEEVKLKRSSVCKQNSNCYDVKGARGYRCNCSEGFRGNPYVLCKDINECEDGSHQCIGRCINMEGSYHCPCPLGKQGNGRKDGDGCKPPKDLTAIVGTGLLLLFIIVSGSFLIFWGLKKKKLANTRRKYFFRNGGYLLQQQAALTRPHAKIFSIDELQTATENFSDNRIVGRGGYGTVYKGILPNQTVIAIKKSKVVDQNQIEQFINEVLIVSKINHPNVVKLFGCCLESEVPLLVYEFIPNGSLFDHVHKPDSVSWKHRLRIALETAKAIAHLHSKSSIPIIHRDIKSANILLDEDYTAKVSDFGVSRLVPYDQTHVTTVVQGTLGYLDPEYFHTSQLTEKSDVYSFGVVLVELLTSEKPISFCRSERNLAAHFTMLLKENRLLEVVDYRIMKEAGALHVYAVAQIAKRCLSLRGEDRPTMNEVAVELNALKKLMVFHYDEQKEDGIFPLGKPSGLERIQSERSEASESRLLS